MVHNIVNKTQAIQLLADSSNTQEIIDFVSTWIAWSNSTGFYGGITLSMTSSVDAGVLTISTSPSWAGVSFVLNPTDWIVLGGGSSWTAMSNASFSIQYSILP